jgi:hypothetical protein
MESAGRASRANRLRSISLYLAIALLLAVPCVWQQHIQANDLSSHLYNAWLVQQVSAGELQGLYVVPQFTNVLFDRVLSALLKSGSEVWTERIAVLLAVQVFFWGCFAFVSVTGGRPAFAMTPFLAMAAYGAVFRLGFFNFYISIGICLWIIALLWGGRGRLRLLAVPLFVLAWTAHYLPCLWAAAILAYVFAARRLKPVDRRWLLGACLAAIGAAAAFIALRMSARWRGGPRIDSMLGADQVLTFGIKYEIITAGLVCLCAFLLIRCFEAQPRLWDQPIFQLWILGAAARLLLPDAIRVPFYASALSFIAIRLSLLSAILLCAVLAKVTMKAPEKMIAVGLLALFLVFSFVDERDLNAIETKTARLVDTLPPGSHVIATLKNSRLYVQALVHVLDRPCIGRCFDFGNYEPSTAQFRLRARPGNPYVTSDYDDIDDWETDRFVFRRSDFDLYRLTACSAGTDVCISRVQPGEPLAKQEISLGSGLLKVSRQPK